MRKTDIEKILKQGSVRQKIKLYMTDSAMFNVDMNHLDGDIDESGKLNIRGSKLLSERERNLLWESIKEPKDVEYYNNMRTINKAFVFFKEQLSKDKYHIALLISFLTKTFSNIKSLIDVSDAVNELLDFYPDKKSREKAIKHTLKEWKEAGGRIQQEPKGPPYFDINTEELYVEADKEIELINKKAESIKQLIYAMKKVLSKDLPLQPYKDWLKKQEEDVIRFLESAYGMTTKEDSEDFSLGDRVKDIVRYQYIETKVTEEDLEDFKEAGI